MKYLILLTTFIISFAANAATPQNHMVEEIGDSCVCKLVSGEYPSCAGAWGSNGTNMKDYVTNRCAENKSARITKKTYIYNNDGEVVSVVIDYVIDDPKQNICRDLFDKNCVR